MKKAAAAALTTSAAVAHGVDLAGQVSATAAEMIRTRRDPAVQAREEGARGAVAGSRAWSAGAVVGGAVTATGAVDDRRRRTDRRRRRRDGVVPGPVLIWCIVGVVRASVDLRVRKRVARRAAGARSGPPGRRRCDPPEMARLDGYSDGLRQLVGMIGIVEDDPSLRQLRDEILAAADVSEARLRRQAKDLTGLLKARRTAPPAAAAQLDGTVKASASSRSVDGVAGYGELVSAASEAVVASRNLADRTAHPGACACR